MGCGRIDGGDPRLGSGSLGTIVMETVLRLSFVVNNMGTGKETYRIFESKCTVGFDKDTTSGSMPDLHGAFVVVSVAGIVDDFASTA